MENTTPNSKNQENNCSRKKIISQLVSENKIQGIISDNRFGVRSQKTPPVIITHQLNVLTGITTF